MKFVATIIVLIFSLNLKAEECPLEGYWKSHEAKTLESLKAAKNVSDKHKQLFENNFFGKLFMHIECDKFTAIMEDWQEVSKYTVIKASKESVTIKYNSTLEGIVEREALITGECYSLEINNNQFREYFCPVTEKAYNE